MHFLRGRVAIHWHTQDQFPIFWVFTVTRLPTHGDFIHTVNLKTQLMCTYVHLYKQYFMLGGKFKQSSSFCWGTKRTHISQPGYFSLRHNILSTAVLCGRQHSTNGIHKQSDDRINIANVEHRHPDDSTCTPSMSTWVHVYTYKKARCS